MDELATRCPKNIFIELLNPKLENKTQQKWLFISGIFEKKYENNDFVT
jgi:hypothetical protein